HSGAADRAPEGGPRERLGHDVDGETVRVSLDDGEARARDIDAGVDAEILRDGRRRDFESNPRRVRPRVADGPDLLDDAGEHLAEHPFQRQIVAEPAHPDVVEVARFGNALERRWPVAAG